MKKADFFIIIGVVLLAGICFGIFMLSRGLAGQEVVITSRQTQIGVYDLNENQTIRVLYGDSYNLVEIKDCTVRVVESDCKNQICVQTHAISEAGESIVCLPHKLIVTIE